MLPEINITGMEGLLTEFLNLSLARQANRAAMGDLTADSTQTMVMRLTAQAIQDITDYTADVFSPVLTGTLRSAHRSGIELLIEEEDYLKAEGYLYIDPYVVNPVLGGRPAEYGLEVRERNDWIANAMADIGDEVLEDLADSLANGIFKLMVL